uniref:Uncharacterized protein n=1 Tax=Leptobrachium leishanense TaxID=445787 RepID=A0A8C5WE35_9ANUR
MRKFIQERSRLHVLNVRNVLEQIVNLLYMREFIRERSRLHVLNVRNVLDQRMCLLCIREFIQERSRLYVLNVRNVLDQRMCLLYIREFIQERSSLHVLNVRNVLEERVILLYMREFIQERSRLFVLNVRNVLEKSMRLLYMREFIQERNRFHVLNVRNVLEEGMTLLYIREFIQERIRLHVLKVRNFLDQRVILLHMREFIHLFIHIDAKSFSWHEYGNGFGTNLKSYTPECANRRAFTPISTMWTNSSGHTSSILVAVVTLVLGYMDLKMHLGVVCLIYHIVLQPSATGLIQDLVLNGAKYEMLPPPPRHPKYNHLSVKLARFLYQTDHWARLTTCNRGHPTLYKAMLKSLFLILQHAFILYTTIK